MATIDLLSTGFCGGGDHVSIQLTINGNNQPIEHFHIDTIIEALETNDARNVITTLLRLHKIGKTNAQVKTALSAGISLVI